MSSTPQALAASAPPAPPVDQLGQGGQPTVAPPAAPTKIVTAPHEQTSNRAAGQYVENQQTQAEGEQEYSDWLYKNSPEEYKQAKPVDYAVRKIHDTVQKAAERGIAHDPEYLKKAIKPHVDELADFMGQQYSGGVINPGGSVGPTQGGVLGAPIGPEGLNFEELGGVERRAANSAGRGKGAFSQAVNAGFEASRAAGGAEDTTMNPHMNYVGTKFGRQDAEINYQDQKLYGENSDIGRNYKAAWDKVDAERSAKISADNPTKSPAHTAVEQAGGTYRGTNSGGLVEVTLPRTMTDQLPIADRFKDFVSVTLPESSIKSPEDVKRAMNAKFQQMGGKPAPVDFSHAYGATGKKVGEAPTSAFDEAVKHYGTTEDINKAGFIGKNGDMLDFSEGQSARTLDHGDVGEISGVDKRSPREDFVAKTGAVRVLNGKDGTSIHFDVNHPPTDAQLDRIVPLLGEDGRSVNVDVSTMDKEKYGANTHMIGGAIADVTDRDSLDRVIRDARKDANKKLAQKPSAAEPETAAPNDDIAKTANEYNAKKGQPEIDHSPAALTDTDSRAALADEYEAAKHDPKNPEVKKAYSAMKQETLDQFNHLQKAGIKFDFTSNDPYKNAAEMMKDVRDNKHLSVYTESGVSKDHPLAEVEPKTGQTYNTIFRGVHDVLGHTPGGHDFSEAGEESAFKSHAQMYSPEARPAVAAETQGQSNWFFNNKGVRGGKAPGDFAEQKATILEGQKPWTRKATDMMDKSPAGGIDPRTGKSDTAGVGTEIYPEGRGAKPLDHRPTEQDLNTFYEKNKDVFSKHPELRVGWDKTDKGWELNIGAAGTEAGAKTVGTKLGQRAVWDIGNEKEIPTGGNGDQTKFPGYPLEQRLADLKGGSDFKKMQAQAMDLRDQAGRIRPGQKRTALVAQADQLSADAAKLESDHYTRLKGGNPETETYNSDTGKLEPNAVANATPTVSTRVPTKTVKGETIEDHTNHSLTSDMDAAKAAPGYVQKMVDRVQNVPGLMIPNGSDAQAAADAYIRHVADNVKFVHSKLTPEEIARDEKWYPVGAHNRVQDVAKQHGFTPSQIAGVTAVESPMTDWDQNTSLAERTANIWKNQQSTKFTPEMREAADKIASIPANAKFKTLFKPLEGKTLGQLKNVEDQALWLRLYDEAHNPREYQTWNPDGTSGGTAKNVDGSSKNVGWSFQNHIEKAIRILKDGSPENISRELGYGHKVRNFYNNIISPDDPRYLTIDTHAVAAGQLRPLSGKMPDTSINFGGIKNGANGLSGTYPLNDAGYRLAAKELDTAIPSRLQSPVWAKIRNVFTQDFKTPENMQAVDAIWKEHTDGKITADQARQRIWDYASGWDAKAAGENGAAGDAGKLSTGSLFGQSSEGTSGRGTRSGATDRATEKKLDAQAKTAADAEAARIAKNKADLDAYVARKAAEKAMKSGLSKLGETKKK